MDGFEAHYMGYEALKMFHDAKILCVKEYSHTSHRLQPFDDRPAQRYKSSLGYWLPIVRSVLDDTMDTVAILLASLATESSVTS